MRVIRYYQMRNKEVEVYNKYKSEINKNKEN